MRRLWLDTETRSARTIKHGNVAYATNVEMTMLQYGINDGPVIIIDMLTKNTKARMRRELQILKLKDEIKLADEVWAHQAEFDRTVTVATKVLDVPVKKWRCTAALARMHGLPGGLDKLCTIFNVPEEFAKLKGKDIGSVFWSPKKDGTYNTPESHPKEWAQFLYYGGRDVEAMRYIWKKLPKWNATPRMWAMWDLDFRMNHRGVAMDLTLAKNALAALEKVKRKLADRTEEITEGEVERTTQRDRLLAYMADYGVDLPDLTADTVERRLDDEALPEHIKELLRIRQQASKASTAKFKRVLNQHVGGRLFNLLVFCGAMRTGRWAGRTFQPQNLPRPKHKPWEIALAISAFHANAIEAIYPDDIMGIGASCLRGLIVAEKGRKLVTSDLANIEGRFMAWIAGEEWKLEAFAAYDRGEGPDMYKLSYARPFNIDPNDIADEGDQRRQIGKVMELALQYYGGVGAFCSMAETYGLRLDKLATAAWPTLPIEIKREAKQAWAKAIKRRRTYGLPERTWIVCQALVTMWRNANPMIVAFWKALDNAIKAALKNPGKKYKAGEKIVVDRKGSWLRVRLPSGRYLNYPATRVTTDGRFTSRSFLGVDPYTKQWRRLSTYSGKDAENVVQGGSADIIMDGLLEADRAGYYPVLSVHDEAVTEPPDSPEFTDKGLSKILVEASLWAYGLPLAAKGKTSYRYSK